MNDAHMAGRLAGSTGDFRLGDLRVFPASGRIVGPGGEEQVDPKVMAVFELLARNAGELVTRDMLLDSIWEGRVVSDDVVSRCIYQLRRHLVRAGGAGRGYRGMVKTHPRRGYQLDAAVQPLEHAPSAPARERRRRARVVAALVALATTAVAWWVNELAEPDPPPAVAVAPVTAPNSAPTVAILPFVDLSADADQAYFADGISEEIIGRLATYRDLRVIGCTSSFSLRDSGLGSREISELLGAQFLLEGSLRKDGDALRISAQLVDQDGVHRWGATFDRELPQIFAIQSEIAQVVAASILPQVAPAARQPRQPDIEAYREYLVGKDLLARRTGLYFDEPVKHFSRAIEIDPDFAEAYAARAIGLFFRSRSVGRHDEQIEQALRDVETAIALDPALGQAYAAKALLMERVDPGNPEREALLRRVLELDPALADAWNWLAGVLYDQARIEESEQALLQGARIDPLAPAINVNLALQQSRKGRAAEAARRLERLLRVPQPSPMVADGLVEIYLGSGRFAEALAAAKRLVLDASPMAGRAMRIAPLVMIYSRLGMHDEARYWVERQADESPASYYPISLFFAYLARDMLCYEETLARYHTVLETQGLDPAQLPVERQANYGELLALTGDHAGAIAVLEPILKPDFREQRFVHDLGARHALAWSWQRTGQSERAAAMLQELAGFFLEDQELGLLEFGDDLASAALNSLLLGDLESARAYLARAVGAGWRDSYAVAADPRWDRAHADPALNALLEEAGLDLERQRAGIEAAEDHHAFVVRVDAIVAAAAGRALNQ